MLSPISSGEWLFNFMNIFWFKNNDNGVRFISFSNGDTIYIEFLYYGINGVNVTFVSELFWKTSCFLIRVSKTEIFSILFLNN